MSVCTLIPSHIHYDGQLELLDRAIKSLKTQTYKTDVYVSISFSNDTYKVDFAQILRKHKDVSFTLHKNQMFQMFHISSLCFKIKDKKYDLITFLDDDDYYDPERIRVMIETYITNISVCGVREMSGDYEYWCYGVKLDVLLMFFKIMMKTSWVLMRNPYGDLFLRYFLVKKEGLRFMEIHNRKLYHYNTDNKYSITGNKEKFKDGGNESVMCMMIHNGFNNNNDGMERLLEINDVDKEDSVNKVKEMILATFKNLE